MGIVLDLPFFDVKDSSPMMIVLLDKLTFLYLRFTISSNLHPVRNPKRNILANFLDLIFCKIKSSSSLLMNLDLTCCNLPNFIFENGLSEIQSQFFAFC